MKPSIVRSESFGSVTVFSLDRQLAIERLTTAAVALAGMEPEVIDIHLIGSLARGDAVPGSDADLVVRVRDDGEVAQRRPLDRGLPWSDVFVAIDLPIDLVVLTPSESAGSALWSRVESEGIPLHRPT